CPHCPQTEETIYHYLFVCLQYQPERHVLAQALGWKATSLSHLLPNPAAIPHLVHYINKTHHLKSILGKILMPTT
ncbi:uncharacterized protein BJ212DRAFT_1279786, partial [Suillus subaureus]